MRAPGEETTLGERVAAGSTSPSSSTGFMAIFTTKGPVNTPTFCASMSKVEAIFGERLATNPEGWDALESAFSEGPGMGVWVLRVVGVGNVAASNVLVDAAGKKVIKVTAASPGEWANTLKTKIVEEGGKIKIVVELGGKVLEASPLKTTKAELLEWVPTNIVITSEAESALAPKVQTIELAGGKAELGAATGVQLLAALEKLPDDLGPGQVAAPNFSGSEEAHLAIMGHCALHNRRALLDHKKGATKAELITLATALSGAPEHRARFAILSGSWAIIPGQIGSTTRTVPYSGVQMGLIARSEANGNGPGKAVAGSKRGKVRWAQGLLTTFTKEERAELSAAGVTCAVLKNGVPTTFDNRTLVAEATDPNWVGFSESRLVMAVRELARQVLEGYEFEDIDGHGYIFKDLEGEMGARACKPFYDANELYGATPAEAYAVNTGPEVNTEASIEAEEIKAQIAVRSARTGRFLSTEVVKVPISEAVA